MNTKWEINGKVSTPEQIFDEIKSMVAQPVGIVLFGADCELKNEVVEKMISSLPGLATSTNAAPTPTLVKYIQEHSMIAVILTPEESAVHGLRHELVKVMRNAGAKTMVGIYAKAKLPRKIPTRHLSSEAKEARLASERCIVALSSNPPSADGLDYFVVVEEKEG